MIVKFGDPRRRMSGAQHFLQATFQESGSLLQQSLERLAQSRGDHAHEQIEEDHADGDFQYIGTKHGNTKPINEACVTRCVQSNKATLVKGPPVLVAWPRPISAAKRGDTAPRS